MPLNLFQKKISDVDDNIVLDKCTNNCDRYIHAPKTVCCGMCNGISGDHSQLCQDEHKVAITSITINFKTTMPNRTEAILYLEVCFVKQIHVRLLHKLEKYILKRFVKGPVKFLCGTEDDLQFKPAKLHDTSKIYIKGKIVEIRKNLLTVLKQFFKENAIEDDALYFHEEINDKKHCILDMQTKCLSEQFYLLSEFEDRMVKQKVGFFSTLKKG